MYMPHNAVVVIFSASSCNLLYVWMCLTSLSIHSIFAPPHLCLEELQIQGAKIYFLISFHNEHVLAQGKML